MMVIEIGILCGSILYEANFELGPYLFVVTPTSVRLVNENGALQCFSILGRWKLRAQLPHYCVQ